MRSTRLARFFLALSLAVTAASAYTATASASVGEQEEVDAPAESGKCRIYCLTHQVHEIIDC